MPAASMTSRRSAQRDEVIQASLQELAPPLLRYFRRRVDHAEDAADLVAECFYVIWKRRSVFPADAERARMWTYGIAANVLKTWRRKAGRRSELVQRLREHLMTWSSAPELESVRDALARLPDTQVELIQLVHWDGFTIIDAAALLGISESTARGRYQRARAILAADPAIAELRRTP